jgi:FkbM family methyltransferase
MLTFYSQQGEDMYIYKKFINKLTPDGIFVELGGLDGITYSNTKFFEDTLSFTGLLIEPTHQFEMMTRNRPNCTCKKIAVSYTQGDVKFIGDHATAGLVESMSENFRNTHHNNSHEYYVKGELFKNILSNSNIKYIDLLSIDVEGGEQVVLETLDFNIPIYVIVIELDNHSPSKDDKCREILIKNGFTFDIRFCINEFWVNNNYFRKDQLFDKNSVFTLENTECNFLYMANHCKEDIFKVLNNS